MTEFVDRQELLSALAELPRFFPNVDPSLLESYITALQHEKVVKFGDQYVLNTFSRRFRARLLKMFLIED